MIEPDTTTGRRLRRLCAHGLLLLAGSAWLVGCSPRHAPAPTQAEGGPVSRPSWFKSTTGEQLEPLQVKIREWETKQVTTRDVLARLQKDKQEVVNRLRETGVSSSKDLKDNPKAQRCALELHDIAQKIAVVEKKEQEYDNAIDTGKAKLRSFERELLVKKVGVSEQELADLRTIILNLDNKLTTESKDVAVDLKLDATVDKELQAGKKP